MASSLEKDLFKILSKLSSLSEMRNFLTDICTPSEIKALALRWQVAQLLDKKKASYREIAKITGASVTTVTRVARFLKFEPHQGYRKALEKINSRP